MQSASVDGSPSISKPSSASFLATFLEPTKGSPSFHPAFAIMIDQISRTATPSCVPTSRHASAYFFVCSAVLRGSANPITRSLSSSWYSLIGGGVIRISRGFCAVTLGCCTMAFRYCLKSLSGTSWPVELPGKQASLAPKKMACKEN